MEIKLVRGGTIKDESGSADTADTWQDSHVVMLKVTGDGDFYNPIVSRARELILKTGSQAMLDSFDSTVLSKKKKNFAK